MEPKVDVSSLNFKKNPTYTCPNSWAIVNAADRPLSWTIAQDDGRHIVPNSANPNVSHLIWFAFRQICSLEIGSIVLNEENEIQLGFLGAEKTFPVKRVVYGIANFNLHVPG